MSRIPSIADVYMTLLVETGGVAKQIETALRNVDARKIGREIGRELQQGVKDVKVDVQADTTKARQELTRLEREKPTVTVQAKV